MSVAIVNGNYYDTLAEALNAVEAGGTVTLLQDVPPLDSTLEIDKSVMFELSGWGITGNIVVKGSAEVTFRGGQMTAFSGSSVIDVRDEAKLNLDDMVVTGGETINGSSAIQAIVYQSTGALNITGSRIYGGSVTHDETCTAFCREAEEAITASQESGGTITIENSVIEGGKGNTDATPTGKYDSNLFVCGAVALNLSGNASVEVKNSTIHGGDSNWYDAADALNVAIFKGTLSISDNSVISGGNANYENGNWGEAGQGIRVTLNAGACKRIDITDSRITGGTGISEGEGVSLYKNVPMNIENSTISAGGNGAGCITFMTLFTTEYDVTLKDVTLDGAADANEVIQYQNSDKAEGIKIAGELTIAGGTLEDVTFSNVEAGTVIKTTGTGTVDNSTVFADNAVAIFDDETGEYKFESVDKSTLLVNADWSGKARGDKIDGHEGYYFGLNAFDSLNDASKALTGEDVEIVLSGDKPILAEGIHILGNVTLSGNAVIQRNGTNIYIGYENGDGKLTIAEGTELDFTNNGTEVGNGFIVSDGRTENGVTDRYHGELFIDNAHVKANYLFNRNITTISGDDVAISETANLSVFNGFIIGSRPESETGDTNVATVTINKKAFVEVGGGNNYVEIGKEGAGALVVDDAKFVTSQLVEVDDGSRIQLTDAEFSATHMITNNGSIQVSGESTVNINSVTGNAIDLNGTLKNSKIGGRVDVFVSSTIKDSTIKEIYFTAENGESVNGTIEGSVYGVNLVIDRRVNDEVVEAVTGKAVVKSGAQVVLSSDAKNEGHIWNKIDSELVIEKDAEVQLYGELQNKGAITVSGTLIVSGDDNTGATLAGGAANSYDSVGTMTIDGGRLSFAKDTWAYVGGCEDSKGEHAGPEGSKLVIQNEGTLELNGAADFKVMTGASVSVTGNSLLDASGLTGSFEVRDGASISIEDSALDVASLTNNGTISMDYTSTVAFESITNAGTITVDAAGFSSGVYKIFDDLTGSYTETKYRSLLGDANWNDSYQVIDNDLYLTSLEGAELYVDSAWASMSPNEEVTFVDGTKAYYKLNAFDTVANALALPTGETAYENAVKLNITGATEAITVIGTKITEVNSSAKTSDENAVIAEDALTVNLVQVDNSNAGWEVYYPLAAGSAASVYGGITTNLISNTFTSSSKTNDPNFIGGAYAGSTATVYGNTTVNIGEAEASDDALQLNTGYLIGAGAGTVNGDSTVNIMSGTVSVDAVVGGGAWGGQIKGNSSVIISGGKVTVDSDKASKAIYGGSNGSNGNGDTALDSKIEVKGNAEVNGKLIGGSRITDVANTSVSIMDTATVTGNIFGGGNKGGQVSGNTVVTVSGNAVVTGDIFGGGEGGEEGESTVMGSSAVFVTGGTVNGNIYASGLDADVNGNATVTITGGTVAGDIYGGGKGEATVNGSRTLNLGSADAAAYAATLNNVYDFDVAQIVNADVTVTGDFSVEEITIAGATLTIGEDLSILSGNGMSLTAAAVNVNGTLTNGGDITLSDGSKLTAGTLTNNGSITWDLTTEASTLSDYSTVEGNGTYELSISAGLAVGDYVLAYNATGSLDGKNTFAIAGLSETGTLKINGAAFVYDGWNYRLSTRDMNSDGNADLVFSVKAEPQVAKVVSDFNKSGVSDLLAVDDNQMVSLLYDADGAFTRKDVWGLGDWTLRETKGDYNGDGYADAVISYDDGTVTSVAVLKNKADADNVAFEHTDVRGFNNSDWEYLGAADVNGDGITDILTIETKGAANGDRNVNAWIMGRDGTYQSDMRVSGKNDDWEIIGFSDVTGDGKENVILSYNNEVAYWEHNGTNDSVLKNLGDITGREVLGFGDFDGDGKCDVLLDYTEDHTFGMWTETGAAYTRLGQLSDLDEGWSFARIGDCNGDGRDDILWSSTDGKLAFSGANKDDFSKLTVIA